MNNRVQQRFDRSIKDAVAKSGQTEANERFLRRARERADRRLPDVMSHAVPSEELDALIARLAARDGAQPE